MWRKRLAVGLAVGLIWAGLSGAALASCSDPMGDALALEKGGDWESALGIYRAVLEEHPGDLEALSGAATALWLLGRYDEALPYQETVVAADPEDGQTRMELGFNYLNHQGRSVDAVRVLEEGVMIEESDEMLVYLGLARRESGDLRGAEEAFRRAIEVDPSYGYAYRLLVALLEDQGRTEDAALVVRAAREEGVKITEGE